MHGGERGGKIRAAVSPRAGFQTIPHIFVGGAFIGGATDALDAFRDGRLQGMLREQGIDIDGGEKVDLCSFLPSWLHPR